jgi:hypothetical protein
MGEEVGTMQMLELKVEQIKKIYEKKRKNERKKERKKEREI